MRILKRQQCVPYWDASNTLFDQIGGHICTGNSSFGLLFLFCTKCAYEDWKHNKVLLSLITLVFFCPLVLVTQAKLQSVQNHLFIFWDLAKNLFFLFIFFIKHQGPRWSLSTMSANAKRIFLKEIFNPHTRTQACTQTQILSRSVSATNTKSRIEEKPVGTEEIKKTSDLTWETFQFVTPSWRKDINKVCFWPLVSWWAHSVKTNSADANKTQEALSVLI